MTWRPVLIGVVTIGLFAAPQSTVAAQQMDERAGLEPRDDSDVAQTFRSAARPIGRPDQPPPRLRRSAEALRAKAEGLRYERPQPSAPPALSLDEAIARAVAYELSLRAARTDIDVALGRRQQAALRPNPTVTVEQRGEPAGTDQLTSVGAEWPLDLFRREGRVTAADREVDATRLAVLDRERLLVADVRLQYGAAAAALRDLQVADDLANAARRQLDLLRARVDEGIAPPLDRDLLDVEVRRLDVEGVRAAGRAEVAMLQLRQVLGMSPDQPLQLGETLEQLVARATASIGPRPSSGDAPAGVPDADARVDVREAEARMAVADARRDLARREGRVDVSVFGTYMRMDAGFPQQAFGAGGALERVRGRFHYVAGGVRVALPLVNRQQGAVAAAEAERRGAEARLAALRLAADTETATARVRDAQARQAVALYRDTVRTFARQNLDVVQQTFDLGRATMFDVLAEQRRYLDVEREYTTMLREGWEAHTAVTRARGDIR